MAHKDTITLSACKKMRYRASMADSILEEKSLFQELEAIQRGIRAPLDYKKEMQELRASTGTALDGPDAAI